MIADPAQPDRSQSSDAHRPHDRAGGGDKGPAPQGGDHGDNGQKRPRKRGGRRRGKKNRESGAPGAQEQASQQPQREPREGDAPRQPSHAQPSHEPRSDRGERSGDRQDRGHGHDRGDRQGHSRGGGGHSGGGGNRGGGRGDGGGERGGDSHAPKKRLGVSGAAPLSEKAKLEVFDTKKTFTDLGLSEKLVETLKEVGFTYPTAIQSQIIPLILQGKDVLGQARTGTGKTAAFGLPMLDRLEPHNKHDKAKGEFQGLVMVPTRELAIQVATDISELGERRGLRVLPVYGGQNIRTQSELLERGPEIIVGTPGRLMDMVERGYIHYRNMRMVVLDEVDRMLDIGFRDDIRRILRACPPHPQRQTIFVSATISGDIESLARSFATDPVKMVASAGSLTAAMVKQYYLAVQPWDKRALLKHLLTHEEPALTVVFCRMKRTVDEVALYLNKAGIEAHAMHGDMYQNKRNKVIERLRAGNLSVLVASDLASRGLDVEGITHVINYDLPEDPDLYVHRVGRTARAGRDGVAWALVTPEQGPLLTQIERLINAEIPKLDYPDFKAGPLPRHVQEQRQADERRHANAKSQNRFAASVPKNVPPTRAVADTSKFPGGVVPSKLPDRRLGGRMKTARSIRAANQSAPSAQPPQPPTAGD